MKKNWICDSIQDVSFLGLGFEGKSLCICVIAIVLFFVFKESVCVCCITIKDLNLT